MKKRIYAVRCSDDLLAQIDEICQANHLSRSAFLNSSLRHYLMVMAENGLISVREESPQPIQEEQAPNQNQKQKQAQSQDPVGYSSVYFHYENPYENEDEDDEDLGLLAAEEDLNEE